jgi:hypothetical protein
MVAKKPTRRSATTPAIVTMSVPVELLEPDRAAEPCREAPAAGRDDVDITINLLETLA